MKFQAHLQFGPPPRRSAQWPGQGCPCGSWGTSGCVLAGEGPHLPGVPPRGASRLGVGGWARGAGGQWGRGGEPGGLPGSGGPAPSAPPPRQQQQQQQQRAGLAPPRGGGWAGPGASGGGDPRSRTNGPEWAQEQSGVGPASCSTRVWGPSRNPGGLQGGGAVRLGAWGSPAPPLPWEGASLGQRLRRAGALTLTHSPRARSRSRGAGPPSWPCKGCSGADGAAAERREARPGPGGLGAWPGVRWAWPGGEWACLRVGVAREKGPSTKAHPGCLTGRGVAIAEGRGT